MKNNIFKIINEKYEKYSIGYSKIKCPKFEHFGMMRHSFFGRCPIFFSGKIDPALLQKMARTPMPILPTTWRQKPAGIDKERNYATVTLPTVQAAC